MQRGITARYDRRHRFRLSRVLDSHGFHVYVLANEARSQRVRIDRSLFDRFRATLRQTTRAAQKLQSQGDMLQEVYFRNRPQFSVTPNKSEPGEILIRQLNADKNSTGSLSVAWKALATLDRLLYHPALRHPNDLLERIVGYHKLFQFSFTDTSQSITSNLILRKDVLCEVTPFVPTLPKRRESLASTAERPKGGGQETLPPLSQDLAKATRFKTRLAEKEGAGDYRVDYDALFGADQGTKPSKPLAQGRTANSGDPAQGPQHCIPLPLFASSLKAFTQPQFRCEFGPKEIQELRRSFLAARDDAFYVGFEILDCVFPSGRGLQSFRFPLYYFPVTVSESGRDLILHPLEDGKLYLNHLALANLLEAFGDASRGQDPQERFFNALLAQSFEVDSKTGSIHLVRALPHAEEIYSRTREILLGLPGEAGKGGLLGDLSLSAIECDLEAVHLYKTTRPTSPLVAALEADLDNILESARLEPSRFYDSLLGSFLIPEGRPAAQATAPFCEIPWIPGPQPRSTRNLLTHLNEHGLVLLEGPPGTGKTFAIANLIVHCVCAGKRLLVVSDQRAAIDAISERLEQLIAGHGQQSQGDQDLAELWRAAIKVIGDVPAVKAPLAAWVRELGRMLGLESAKELEWPKGAADLPARLRGVDDRLEQATAKLDALLAQHFGEPSEGARRMGARMVRPADEAMIRDVKGLLHQLRRAGGDELAELLGSFVSNRKALARLGLQACHDLLIIPKDDLGSHERDLNLAAQYLLRIQHDKPRSIEGLTRLAEDYGPNLLTQTLEDLWRQAFAPGRSAIARLWQRLKTLRRHPLVNQVAALHRMIVQQQKLIRLCERLEPKLIEKLRAMHDALAPEARSPVPVELELCLGLNRKTRLRAATQASAQAYLEEMAELQHERDALVREQFLSKLGAIARRALLPAEPGGTSHTTSILATLETLEPFGSLQDAQAVLRDLKAKLFDAYPVWICRKRAVPFLFPCKEQAFDLVVVDEATQCRVDDAMPLLFRARKLLAVGDEKQTVLAKNSVLDDYIFRDFDLDEHLRFAQARSMKGGGSHLFGLVGRIKQASVMLEEHYRCPPEIIAFSNQYVYDNELKVMQWRAQGSSSTVIVDHSEAQAPPSERKTSGKFRGTETEMVDRFLDYVARAIRSLEKQTNERINMETDVALCYFLLKNEAYVKSAKTDFLRRLKRGRNVLDGAGTALQGKERDYIFYLWDVTRANMMAFRQGDDPSKRKGELNVLMSRPKRRAYHFLHRDFASLDHGSATVTDFLWRTLAEQNERAVDQSPPDAQQAPDLESGREVASGPLVRTLLQEVVGRGQACQTDPQWCQKNTQMGVVVGDRRRVVDLVLLNTAQGPSASPIGVVDLASFRSSSQFGRDVRDYFFQLQRAAPPIRPVVLFVHELLDPESLPAKRLRMALAE